MPAPFNSSAGNTPDGTAGGGPGATTPSSAGLLLDLIRIATFVLDPDGRIAVWSPAAVDLTGRPLDEMLGADVTALFPDGARTRANELFHKVPDRSRWIGFLPVLRGDGSVFDVGFCAVTLRYPDGRDLIQVVATDAGDLRRVEFDRVLFEALFDQVPIGIACYDTDRRYVRVNQAMTAYSGVRAEDYLGRRVEDVLPGLDESVPRLQQQVLDTGEPVVNLLIKAPTAAPPGMRYWSLSYARLESHDGQVLGLTGVVADITERQTAQERNRLARRRTELLNAANSRIGTSLEFGQTATELADVAVPMFCDAITVYLLDSIDGAATPSTPPTLTPTTPTPPTLTPPTPTHPATTTTTSPPSSPSPPLRLHTIAARCISTETNDPLEPNPAKYLSVPPGTALHGCLSGKRAQFYRPQNPDHPHNTHPRPHPHTHDCASPPNRCIVAPLVARGTFLGAVCFSRAADHEEFSQLDLETADELTARAAASMDNARLYLRERNNALLLQRSLMPEQFAAVDEAQIAFRYRPGSVGAQVGGDWFDVIALPCRRVAFVVGDVMGSGLRAAGIMGQFRTAARTLARLDLSPALVLRELDDLAQSMSESHIATCVFAVYDPVAGECVMASAGHPPPLLITPGGGVEPLDLSPGAPLGVGGQRFEEHEFAVEPASALVLYTDGLVEDRGRDIDTGIDELLGAISKAATNPGDKVWLENVCDTAFESMLDPHRVDDATLLVAALDRFPEEQVASWVLTSQPTVAARARELVRRRLDEWAAEAAAANADDSGLSPSVADVADVVELLVSELVTNALRYGRGPIGLRLLRGPTIVCEVSDELEAAPRLRTVHHGDEGGRGLYLVDQLSARWGTRATSHGKIVWFEV